MAIASHTCANVFLVWRLKSWKLGSLTIHSFLILLKILSLRTLWIKWNRKSGRLLFRCWRTFFVKTWPGIMKNLLAVYWLLLRTLDVTGAMVGSWNPVKLVDFRFEVFYVTIYHWVLYSKVDVSPAFGDGLDGKMHLLQSRCLLNYLHFHVVVKRYLYL